MKLMYLDTETTGVNCYKNGIIQIAGIIEINNEVREEFNFFVKPFPEDLIIDDALEVSGITRKEIETFDEPTVIYKKLVKIFDKYVDKFNKNDKFILAGQNPGFDRDFVNQFIKKNGNKYGIGSYADYKVFDLCALSRAFELAGIFKLKNHKLETIAQYFGLEFKAHDALEDIKITRKLFKIFFNLLKQVPRI